MKISAYILTVTIFLTFQITCVSISAASTIIKNITLDGQPYSCRPSNIEPSCSLNTDIGFLTSMSADSSDAYMCLSGIDRLQSDAQEKITNCFLQKRIKHYAKELEIQIASHKCWNYFLSKCSENTACPDSRDPQKRCGHLGTFLNTLRSANLNDLFTEIDAITLCKSLSE